ncbi:ABC transporter permease [Vibrio metoecus]|uniref:ABC transporter permease n=1 Tax=Vibrio metoecus TaxID=1481663 RepID=UPI000BA98067|nr:ABC transporter permease [Vibrio metoecus]PAR27576.1 peptide ABC transporter permease [Vibrio metoecus]PAR60867.1 peptide ABC transporter permease [Vibrio metoecus]
MLPIRQIVQEMAAEKLRLSLTILAVAWSTLCIAGLLAVGEGLRSGIVRTIQNGNGNLIHVSGGYATQTHGRFHEGQALSLTEQDSQVLAALPMVKHALPSSEWQELLTFEDKQSWMMPYAVKSEYKAMNKLHLLAGGRWFNPLDESQQRKVVVLGYQLAVQLFNHQEGDWFRGGELERDPIGQIVKIGAHQFTVIGVLAKNSGNIERGSPIDYSGFTPFSTWQRFHPSQAISGINLEPVAGSDRQALAATVQQVLKRKYGASLQDKQIITVQDRFLNQKSMQQFLVRLQSFLGIIGFITLAVASLGITNVMFATVKRATRDIGVRMAVGATPNTIRCHYLAQSLITMGMGGIAGLGVTFAMTSLLATIPLQGNPIYDHLGQPVPELSLSVIAIVIVTLTVMGIVAAWLPANHAAKVTPLQALQSE